MKAFIKVLLFSLVTLLIWSCKKDEVKVVATDGTAAELTASSSDLILAKVNASNNAVTFTFTPPKYGFDAAVTSTLQISEKGTNFSSPKEFDLEANVFTKSFTVIEFNAIMLSMGLETGSVSDIEARIQSSISAQVAPIQSNSIVIKVTPYPLISFVFVPGDYQGWNPSTADSLMSATSNGIYEGVITYAAGGTFQFKITPEKKWDVAYGDAGGGKISTTAGDNLTVPGAGSYQLTVDLNANTLVAVPLSWGIIGDAPAGSGWSNDIDMKYDNGKRTWSATVTMGTGGFKFRKNHDWGTNFGDKTGDLILDTENDNNIPITVAGSYKVVLDIINNSYTLTKL